MTTHRDTRIAWRTLQARIRKAVSNGGVVLWRTLVRGFYYEDIDRAGRKIVDDEAELALGHLMTSGRVGMALGATEDGVGRVVWLTGVGNEPNSEDTDTDSDQGGI